MSPRRPILSILCSLPLIHAANAGTVIADFNDNNPGPLGSLTTGAGQGGGSGFLTGDVWANTGLISVISGDLTAPPSTNFTFVQGETVGAQSVQNQTVNTRQTTRALETALGTSGDIWFSFLLNQPTTNSRGGITFNQPAAQTNPGNPRLVATGTDLRIGLGPTLQTTGAPVSLATDTLIVGQLIIDAAGDETMNVWVNPDVSAGIAGLGAPSTSLSEQTDSLEGGVTRLGIQSYSSDSQGGIVDAFRMSDEPDAFTLVTYDSTVLDDPNLSASAANPFSSTTINSETGAVTADLIVTNSGTTNTLTIADTTAISGADAANFLLLNALPINILPGQNATLQIQFTPPGTIGTFSANLDIDSNDVTSPMISIPLSAQVTPLMQVSTANPFASMAFPLDPSPATADILISNVGASTTLTLSDTTTITGDPAFTILSALPIDILPGQSTTLQVQFDAPAGGNYTGQLDLASNDPGNTLVTIPLAAAVPVAGVNLLANGDFEADNATLPDWQINLAGAGASAVTGITAGSNTAAFVAAGGAIFQDGLIAAENWYVDFYFQTDTTTSRPFNVLIGSGGQQINLRYDGSTWGTFDNGNFNDIWGAPLGLGSITSNGVYFMRIVGTGWGTATPTYSLMLSEAGSPILTRQVSDIARYQNGTPAGYPQFIRFSQEFGGGTGFTVDQVTFVNGTPPDPKDLEITNFHFNDTTDTVTFNWNALPGSDYLIESSQDLETWNKIDDRRATGTTETFTRSNVTATRHYYRVRRN